MSEPKEECAGGCGDLANYDTPINGVYWCGHKDKCAFSILSDQSDVLEGREDYE